MALPQPEPVNFSREETIAQLRLGPSASREADDCLMARAADFLAAQPDALTRAGLSTEPVGEQRGGESFLAQLRRVNTDRYQAWVGEGQDAGILFDAAELGGEVGELLNVVKKLEREDQGWRGSRAAPEDFADECADVLICLDKLARRKGVDLEAATIRKFNATSEKVGLPHNLTTPSPMQDARVGREIVEEAAFLCARLREMEGDLVEPSDAARTYDGHVVPPLARLEVLLDRAEQDERQSQEKNS